MLACLQVLPLKLQPLNLSGGRAPAAHIYSGCLLDFLMGRRAIVDKDSLARHAGCGWSLGTAPGQKLEVFTHSPGADLRVCTHTVHCTHAQSSLQGTRISAGRGKKDLEFFRCQIQLGITWNPIVWGL